MNSTLKILSIACIMNCAAGKAADGSRSVARGNESPGILSAPVANAEPTTSASAFAGRA